MERELSQTPNLFVWGVNDDSVVLVSDVKGSNSNNDKKESKQHLNTNKENDCDFI